MHAFKDIGFLDPETRSSTAEVYFQKYPREFESARQMNVFAMKCMAAVKLDQTSDAQKFAALIFSRQTKSFQATILLAEFGMINEAAAVARGCVEGAIAMSALHQKPDEMLKLLEQQHLRHDWTMIGDLVKHNDSSSQPNPERGSTLAAKKKQILEVHGGKPDPLNWSDVARDNDASPLYTACYRHLSGLAHLSLISLESHTKLDAQGNSIGVVFAPSDTELSNLLVLTSGAMLHCLAQFDSIVTIDLKSEAGALDLWAAEWAKLMETAVT